MPPQDANPTPSFGGFGFILPVFSGGLVHVTSPVAAEAVEVPNTGSSSRTANRPSSVAVRIRLMIASLRPTVARGRGRINAPDYLRAVHRP